MVLMSPLRHRENKIAIETGMGSHTQNIQKITSKYIEYEIISNYLRFCQIGIKS